MKADQFLCMKHFSPTQKPKRRGKCIYIYEIFKITLFGFEIKVILVFHATSAK